MGSKNLRQLKKIIYDFFATIYFDFKVFRIDQKLFNILLFKNTFKFIDYRLVKWQTM